MAASNIVIFIYSFFMALSSSLVQSGRCSTTTVSRVVMSTIVQLGDLSLSFLQFGAATAIAGLRGSFSDGHYGVNYCGVNATWCKKREPRLHHQGPLHMRSN